jgi:hypothetical protein
MRSLVACFAKVLLHWVVTRQRMLLGLYHYILVIEFIMNVLHHPLRVDAIIKILLHHIVYLVVVVLLASSHAIMEHFCPLGLSVALLLIIFGLRSWVHAVVSHRSVALI